MRCPLCNSYAVRKHQRPSQKNNFVSRYYCTSCSKYFGINPDGTILRRKTPHLSLNATKIWQQYVFEGLSFERISSLHNASLASTIKAFLLKNKDPNFTHTFQNKKIYKRSQQDSSQLIEIEWPIKKHHEIGVPHLCPVCSEGTLDYCLGEHNAENKIVSYPHYFCKGCSSSFLELPTQHPIPTSLKPHVIRLFNDEHMNVHHIAHNLGLRIADIRNLLKHQNGKYPAGW